MERKVVSRTMFTLLLIGVLTLAVTSVDSINQSRTTIQNDADDSTLTYDTLSAPPATEWNKTYGGERNEVAYSMVQTRDGGYAIAGYSFAGVAESRDFFLVKADATGNMQWEKTYNWARWYGSDDWAFSVVQTSDDGYAVAGRTDVANGSRFGWLVKTDLNGNAQWNQTYGVTIMATITSVVQTSDGGYALAGFAASGPAWDFSLVKTYPNGNIEWGRKYGTAAGEEVAWSVVQTRDGGYALAGDSRPSGPESQDWWLVKTDSGGNMEWSKTWGGPTGDSAYSVVQTSDNGYAIAGRLTPFGSVSVDMGLIKTDANGNMEWNKVYGGTTTGEVAQSIVQTRDGGYALAGYAFVQTAGVWNTDFFLVRTDVNGNMQWNKTYGGKNDDWGQSIVQTSDRGYALAGTTSSFGWAGSRDFWLIKIAPENPVAVFTHVIQSGGYAVTFDASPSYDPNGVIVRYDWDFGDGRTGTGKIVTHTYSKRNYYWVRLTVTDNEGFTGTTARYVSLGNLKALVLWAVQVIWSPGWLIQGKSTDFRIWYQSTFDVSVTTQIKLDTPGFTPSTYTFSYTFAPGSHDFVIGEIDPWAPRFKPYTKPTVTTQFTIDPYNNIPETNEYDNTNLRVDYVLDTKGLKILFVPVRFDGEATGFSFDEYTSHCWESILYLWATYPIAASELEVISSSEAFNAPVLAGPRPTTEAEADTRMQELIRRLAKRAGNYFDRVVGLVRRNWFAGFPDDPATRDNWQTLAGFAWESVSPKGVVVELDFWATTTHEIGHTYGLGHSNEYGDGFYVLGRRRVTAQTFMATGAIASPPAQSKSRSPVPNFWIRVREYESLIDRLRVAGDPELLLFSGTFYPNDTVVLDNWYRYPSGTPDYEEGSVGNHYIIQRDSLGNTISTVGFNVTFEGTGELEGFSFDQLPTAFTIPYATGTKTVDIVNATGQVVATKIISDNAPTVQVTSPNGGEILSDQVQVSWQASDLDGGPLVYNLLVSKDGGVTWIPIETDLAETTYTLSLTGFSGGNQYLVKVMASDGANTAEDASDGLFTISSFTINVVTSAQIVPLGDKVNYTLTITSYGGFSNPVTLNAGSPTTDKLLFNWLDGSTIVPVPDGSITTTVEVEVPNTTEAGNHTVIFTGTYGSNTQVAVTNLFATSHDLAVTNITPSKTVVGQGFFMSINVTIQNQGNFGDTFTLSLYGNQTPILNQSTYLPPLGSTTTLTFIWNTSGFAKGSYTLSAYAWPVQGETDTVDNSYIGGTVIVAMPCDVANRTSPDPGTPDGRVNYIDVFWFLKAYSKKAGDPSWNPNCDVAGGTTWPPAPPDNIVNYIDIFWLLKYYGQVDP